jgi:alcohol dehydrogenase
VAITNFYLPVKIVEGAGCVGRIADYLSTVRTVVVTDRVLATNGIFAKILAAVQSKCPDALAYSEVDPDPDERIVSSLVSFVRDNSIGQIVAVGGGSALDTAKAAACLAPNEGPMEEYQWEGRAFECPALPLVVIPTTAGTGSEVSGVAVIGSRNTKKGINHPYIFAKTALIDPELTLTLPPFLTVTTGMDALTHGIEAFIGLNKNPLIVSLAESAIRLISRNLTRATTKGDDLAARTAMSHAATMAGIAMDLGGLGIVHSLSAPLCSNLHVAHGLGNTFLLPYSLEYNVIGNETVFSRLAELMGGSGPDYCVERIKVWQMELGLEKSLAEVRDKLRSRNDIEWLADIGAKMFLMKNNPRPADTAACAAILRKAAGL